MGVFEQRDGSSTWRCPTVGRVSGETLHAGLLTSPSARAATESALTAHQKFVIPDVPEDKADTVRWSRCWDFGSTERIPARHDGLHGHRVLQARDRETKARATDLVAELERRILPTFDQPPPSTSAAAPNSCARFQVADIGLKGSSSMTNSRRWVPGPPWRITGALNSAWTKVAHTQGDARRMPDATFSGHRSTSTTTDGESFAQWTACSDEDDLR